MARPGRAGRQGTNDDFGGIRLQMTVQRTGVVAVAPPPTQGAAAAGEAARLRPAALLYLCCVVALAVGGGLLGIRLPGGRAAGSGAHRPVRARRPTKTSFGSVEVESVQQVRGLTPKQLAGMTHGIQSLVKADKLQVQLVLALRNARGTGGAVRTGPVRDPSRAAATARRRATQRRRRASAPACSPRARRWRRRLASSYPGSLRRGRGSR